MTTLQIPKLYSTEKIPLKEKMIYEYWVFPSTNFHWLIAEVDEDLKLAFGYANLNDDQMAEWGYISLDEIEKVGAQKVNDFKPKKFEKALKEIKGGE